ncbi:MAG: NAD-dependent epimerase/dehydratase family protein [Bryobacteraceae bacterium]
MTQSTARTAVIAGGSGLVGSRCLRLLLDSSQYNRVIGIARRCLPVSHPKFSCQQVDFDHLTATPEAEDFFCALGTTIRRAGSEETFRKVDFGYPNRLAQLAVAAGARRFVLVSSVGANSGSRNFYLRVKGELEDALRALPFSALHIFRPSILVGARTERRPREAAFVILAQTLEFLLPGKLRRYRPIEAGTLAAAMVAAATGGEPDFHIYEYDEIRKLAAEPAPDASH